MSQALWDILDSRLKKGRVRLYRADSACDLDSKCKVKEELGFYDGKIQLYLLKKPKSPEKT